MVDESLPKMPRHEQPSFMRDPDFLEWELERTRELLDHTKAEGDYARRELDDRVAIQLKQLKEVEVLLYSVRKELQAARTIGLAGDAISPFIGAGLAVLSCIISLITVLQLANPLLSLGSASFVFVIGFRIAWSYWIGGPADQSAQYRSLLTDR